jgi:hypothetical protein
LGKPYKGINLHSERLQRAIFLLDRGRNLWPGAAPDIGQAYCDEFMDGEALLGTLPDSLEAIFRCGGNGGGGRGYEWAYLNKVTGNFQLEDPRRGPLPPGWDIVSHAGEEFWQLFKNNETGEETECDPRLTSGELRKRGVPLQVFDLI